MVFSSQRHHQRYQYPPPFRPSLVLSSARYANAARNHSFAFPPALPWKPPGLPSGTTDHNKCERCSGLFNTPVPLHLSLSLNISVLLLHYSASCIILHPLLFFSFFPGGSREEVNNSNRREEERSLERDNNTYRTIAYTQTTFTA